METIEINFNDFSQLDKRIFRDFLYFPDFFSIDWFSEYPASKLISMVSRLQERKYIAPQTEHEGFYKWSSDFPLQKHIDIFFPEGETQYRRDSINILLEKMPPGKETILAVANQCLLAGLKEDDLEIVLKAAFIEEEEHRISAATKLYDAILEHIDTISDLTNRNLSETTWSIFTKAVEHRASLSLFHPNTKKINRYLTLALQTAEHIGDLKSQASLKLLIGQNDWMWFRYEKAIENFDQGWNIILQIGDEDLKKRALKLQGLLYAIRGQLYKAIESYEQYLGELESITNDDFSQLTALNLALCYAQTGMPQRGLGISETIQQQCTKNKNWPMVAFSLATSGMILFELKQLNKSRDNFEKALELATRENLPMVEVMSGIGLSSIECQKGNYIAAAEHFKLIWKIRKSSWYHILNLYLLYDSATILHVKGVSPIDLNPMFEFLHQIKKDAVNPLIYCNIKRLQIVFQEENIPTEQKITEFLDLEKMIKPLGATFEMAKVKVELARLFDQTGNMPKAEQYAREAFAFFKPIAKDYFPPDLLHLIPQNADLQNDRLFHMIIEMGEALTDHENIERLLTNIITSIARLTGSERTALFIIDESSADLNLVASRNLLKEETENITFSDSMKAIQSLVSSHDGKIVRYELRTGTSDVRKVIITPLKLGKKVIGALYQDSRFFSIDTESHNVELLSAFASQIAVSIDRARAYDEIARLNKKLIQENKYYLEEKEEFRPFGEIIGSSKSIKNVHRLIQKVAPTQSTVLIQGETGVGKELVARAIHRESSRKNGPFIRVNCAALPETLIDSELFGYEKGAFTGAVKTKEGRFELAHMGTIFLDEVSELPLHTQSRLLRILQEKEFQRVGGTKTLHSDFRLIAATNKPLNQEIKEGKFRADLFFRLNVFPISVPPLRERIEDIPSLATHFLRLYCSQSGKNYSGIQDSEMEKLKTYTWPGNIRELSNMIERAVILDDNRFLFQELDTKTITPSRDDNETLQNYEKTHILEALEKSRGKIGGSDGAAHRLGLKRTTLIARMKKLGIKMTRNPSV